MASCLFLAVLLLASLLYTVQASSEEQSPYTEGNVTYSTLEQILQEIATSEGEEITQIIDKRYNFKSL